MEQKKININIAGPSPLRRIMKKPGFWCFVAGALVVTVAEALDGDVICCLWIGIGVVGFFFADLFKGYADDFAEAIHYMADKIAELNEEINRLKS